MNAFYYHYFLRKRGLVVPGEVEELENEILDYMSAEPSVADAAAGTLGISPNWLSSVPVIFSRKTFSLYIGPEKLEKRITPESDGIAVRFPSAFLVKALKDIVAGSYEPVETPIPRPYALIRAVASNRDETVEKYIRGHFRYDDRQYMDGIIRDVLQAGLCPPAGKMDIADHGVIRDFAKIEDITIDEAASGFEVKDEYCFANLMLSFRFCVSRFTLTFNKDGSLLIRYPGYKLSDFTQSKASPRGAQDVPDLNDSLIRGMNDFM